MASLSAWLWDERFWLPAGVTWADLRGSPGAPLPQASDLCLALPLAFGIFSVRLLFERFLAKPCAVCLGVQVSARKKAEPNAILEKVFTSITKSPDDERLRGLSKQLDLEERIIERWFRRRRNQEKASVLAKFCESMWRLVFYIGIFCYGIVFLWKTPWFWDTKHCWYNYPYQPLSTQVYWYYIAEVSFYWSLMFSQFTDIKRKDFLIMLVHHLVTVLLISFSYVTNMVRVGTLVLCLHDSSDSFLEAAKLANYAKYQKLCDVLFGFFAIIFIGTRLCIYPLWVLNTAMFESWEIIGPYPSWWVFNPMLLLLQVLHIMWSYLILRLTCRAVTRGKVDRDERSDSESGSEEEVPGKQHRILRRNGHVKE
uniref:Ceramide synthase 6 n=1 Tax=Eptatretus burgeri TaxID=7764 RepID=A0A8C4QE66_EPTBU